VNEQITCKEVNCNLRGFWYENIDGEIYYCHNVYHRGVKHTVKTPVREIAQKMREV
jgi:phage-related protein